MTKQGKPSAESDWRQTVTTLAGIVSVLLVAAGLFYTNVANRTQEHLAEQGQVTGRFGSAVGQLGSGKLDVRLGGVTALERLMHDSPTDEASIIEVLSAFAREKTGSNPKLEESSAASLPTDVQAALTVIGTSNIAHDGRTALIDLNRAPLTDAQLQYLHLAGANLSGADLARANLTYTRLAGANLSGADLARANLTYTRLAGANLSGADLSHADLSHVNLTRADLSDVKLIGAVLAGATLTGASFSGATLTGAVLAGAKMPGLSFATATLTGADLSGATLTHGYLVGAELACAKFVNADLTGADLTGADLSGADLRQANLKGANLSYANLTGATLYAAPLTGATLTGATLTGAYWPQDAKVPEGWQRNPSSPHLLERASTIQEGGKKVNTLTSC